MGSNTSRDQRNCSSQECDFSTAERHIPFAIMRCTSISVMNMHPSVKMLQTKSEMNFNLTDKVSRNIMNVSMIEGDKVSSSEIRWRRQEFEKDTSSGLYMKKRVRIPKTLLPPSKIGKNTRLHTDFAITCNYRRTSCLVFPSSLLSADGNAPGNRGFEHRNLLRGCLETAAARPMQGI